MEFQDETLVCKDCGKDFIFTAGEQEFYAEKGFEHKPVRCRNCRDKKKHGRNEERQMFTCICVECGQETQVPFEPKDDRPIYCRDCFKAHRR